MKITAMMSVFNEEHRISRAVKGTRLWSDQVLVLDKGSTDKTVEVAKSLGATVLSIPFSGPGEEDIVRWAQSAKNDWIVGLTPGEQASLALAKFFRSFAGTDDHSTDIFQVPVKIKTFGDFALRNGPWSISYQARLWHRGRVIPQNEIHAPLALTKNTKRLPFRDEFYLLHCTHNTYPAFIEKHKNYAWAEATRANDLILRARQAIEKAERHDIDFLHAGNIGLRSMVAWKAYHYMISLACLTHDLTEEKVREIYEADLQFHLDQLEAALS
jgi:glycosyltransferase involved in cell wall biosynthesis